MRYVIFLIKKAESLRRFFGNCVDFEGNRVDFEDNCVNRFKTKPLRSQGLCKKVHDNQCVYHRNRNYCGFSMIKEGARLCLNSIVPDPIVPVLIFNSMVPTDVLPYTNVSALSTERSPGNPIG